MNVVDELKKALEVMGSPPLTAEQEQALRAICEEEVECDTNETDTGGRGWVDRDGNMERNG